MWLLINLPQLFRNSVMFVSEKKDLDSFAASNEVCVSEHCINKIYQFHL